MSERATWEELAALQYDELVRFVGLERMFAASAIVAKAVGFAGVDMERWNPNFRTWANLHSRWKML